MGRAQERADQEATSVVDGPTSGWLGPGRLDDDRPATVDADVARLHHRLRVDLVDHLSTVVPDGWVVSAGCCWQPALTQAALRPDIAVHRTLAEDDRPLGPPVLCVDITAGPADPRLTCRYARIGVDHHWHLDSRRGSLQVSVRLDDAYRHCETFSAETFVPGDTSAWVDFGVGLAHLERLLPQFLDSGVDRVQAITCRGH